MCSRQLKSGRREEVMNRISKARNGFSIVAMGFALALATVSMLPMATADVDDVVQNQSAMNSDKAGENVNGSCDSTASQLEKRGRLVYEGEGFENTGALRYVDAAD
jgi:hypothetical protein